MRDESHAKTGLITIVTAVITALISSFTTYLVQRQQTRVEHERLEAQLQEKLQEKDRELADEHQKAQVAILAREDEIQQRLARELQGKYFEVVAQNSCPRATVVVAVRYRNLNGKMTVHGWSSVGPGQAVTILRTEDKEFWYFARAVPSELNTAFRPPYGQDDLAVRITNDGNFEYVENGDYSWLAQQAPNESII